MSVKIVQSRLDQYNLNNQPGEENALKEIAQEIILSSLSRAGFFKVAAFQGGTCLRILHGLNRFSEDLDFALNEPDPSFKWALYLKNLQTELEAYGFRFEMEDKNKDKRVKSIFLKSDSIGNLITLEYRDRNSQKQVKIKLEIDTDPPVGAKNEQKYINFPVTVPVVCHDLPSLFACKSHALLCRDFVKGRDWYDFIWHAGRRTPINFHFLSNAIDQLGPWNHQKIIVNKKWYVENLSKKIKNIDWEKQQNDVRRFLKPYDLDLLKNWSPSFFLDQLSSLIPTFHVQVSVLAKNGRLRTYVKENAFYYDQESAVTIGKETFSNTPNVIMVEVFQSGITRPITVFQ